MSSQLTLTRFQSIYTGQEIDEGITWAREVKENAASIEATGESVTELHAAIQSAKDLVLMARDATRVFQDNAAESEVNAKLYSEQADLAQTNVGAAVALIEARQNNIEDIYSYIRINSEVITEQIDTINSRVLQTSNLVGAAETHAAAAENFRDLAAADAASALANKDIAVGAATTSSNARDESVIAKDIAVGAIDALALDSDVFSIVHINLQNLTSNYTLPLGYNGLSMGPVTIDPPNVLTISAGSTWRIL